MVEVIVLWLLSLIITCNLGINYILYREGIGWKYHRYARFVQELGWRCRRDAAILTIILAIILNLCYNIL